MLRFEGFNLYVAFNHRGKAMASPAMVAGKEFGSAPGRNHGTPSALNHKVHKTVTPETAPERMP